MRLFLSSYGLGNKPEELIKLLRGKTRTVVIPNAGDGYDSQEKDERIKQNIQLLEDLGLEVSVLDLRDYFNNQEGLRDILAQTDLVWVRGGNTFVLRRAMKQSGFDILIKEFLNKDQVVYAGYSAGAIVMTPTLRGIELCDDPSLVPKGYDKEILWDGLGEVDFSIAPHYRSGHPESDMIEKTVEYFETNQIPYKALRDGQVVIQDGESTVVIE